MRDWNLTLNSPLSLTLAADAHLTELNYVDDQIWELLLGWGEPGAVLLQTSYGLRARNMRLFPQFVESHQTIADPVDFANPPIINKFFPNFLSLTCYPFTGIEVQMDYWVPNCQMVAGRIQIQNQSSSNRLLRVELAALLNPIQPGQPMVPEKIEAVTVLKGQTGDLQPILFMTGGAEGVSSPYPSLQHSLSLSPEASRRFTWALASLSDVEESFKLARQTVAVNWDAEVAKIEMANAHQVEITTGDPDWDAAFALGQKVARTLLYTPSERLPHTTFVSTRQPDQGFSPQGDGTDYSHLWNGQTSLEAWYLSGLLLPAAPEIVKGILLNFLGIQEEGGYIDWKPGLAGQRGQILATPVLVSLAWRIYQHTKDKDFLDQVFHPLLEFINNWLSDRQDRDGDGIPEWSSPIQGGFDANPSFSRWHSWAQGLDVTLVESPDLCAMLYREIQLLINMAEELERREAISALEAFADNLHSAVEASWDYRRTTYQYWDRETHHSYRGEVLAQRKGSGELLLDIVFEIPTRIVLRLESKEALPVNVQASIHGRLHTGQHRVEQIRPDQFQWIEGVSTLTLSALYADLEHIYIEGLPENGKVSVHIADLRKEDLTHLTPLWAGIPDASTVEKIIERKLTKPNQYYRPFGIPVCPKAPKHPGASLCKAVWLPWNVMVAEGLLAYGARDEAVDLLTRLMAGIVGTLKREHAFRAYYHADLPQSMGERNALLGLPPMELFLETLGVRIHSPRKVQLEGHNPFPWPVKLGFKGLIIECESQKTTIIFPDGQRMTVDDPDPCLVTSDTALEE